MFNLSGSEIVVILLLALVVLGPEKLPEAMRRAGKTYAEIKKLSSGFQDEVRKGFDEPAREVKKTAAAVKSAARLTTDTMKGKDKPRYNPVTDPAPKPPEGSSVAEPLTASGNVVDTTAEEVTAEPPPEIADVAEIEAATVADVVDVDAAGVDAAETVDVVDVDAAEILDAPAVDGTAVEVIEVDAATVADVVDVDNPAFDVGEVAASVVPPVDDAAGDAEPADSAEVDRTA